MELTLLLKIFLLSFVQGVSEFFPISSSGHLVIFQELIGFKTIPLVYDIFFHIGTLFSVLIYFSKDIFAILKGIREKENMQFISLIIVASIPTGMIGLFFKEQLEGMFNKPGIVGYFLLATAFIILISKFVSIKKPNIYIVAFIIGVFQGIAIIPGLSRSGLTISVGLILSMGFIFSFRFSFLLSIPAIIGALILEIDKVPFDSHQIFYLLAGTIFSAVFGLIALYFLKKIILKKKFHYFSYYCFFMGMAVLMFFK